MANLPTDHTGLTLNRTGCFLTTCLTGSRSQQLPGLTHGLSPHGGQREPSIPCFRLCHSSAQILQWSHLIQNGTFHPSCGQHSPPWLQSRRSPLCPYTGPLCAVPVLGSGRPPCPLPIHPHYGGCVLVLASLNTGSCSAHLSLPLPVHGHAWCVHVTVSTLGHGPALRRELLKG